MMNRFEDNQYSVSFKFVLLYFLSAGHEAANPDDRLILPHVVDKNAWTDTDMKNLVSDLKLN